MILCLFLLNPVRVAPLKSVELRYNRCCIRTKLTGIRIWISLIKCFSALRDNKVFVQGAWAFVGNIIIIGILGTLLCVGYSAIGAKSSSLTKED